MANEIWQVDILAVGQTVDVTDDGSGKDWLNLAGSYLEPTSITLSWSYENGASTAAAGTYWTGTGPDRTSGRLIVHGLIENVRGSLTADFISGNEQGNLIFGDQTAGGPGGNDTISAGDGRDTVQGGAGADVIGGGAGNDLLYGNAGADSINGDAGVDTIEGGQGADSLSGGADAHDTVSYATSGAGVAVDITFGTTTTGRFGAAAGDQINGFTDIWGSAFNDVLRDTVKGEIAFGYNANRFDGKAGDDRLELGGGNDTGLGGAGNDILLGEQGNDVLQGGDGDDILRGGAGLDLLTGGAGADHFAFGLVTESVVGTRDRILDFHTSEGDKIDLRDIDTTAAVGNGQFHLIAGAFTGAEGELRVQATVGGVLVSGTGGLSIFVAGVAGLLESDFLM